MSLPRPPPSHTTGAVRATIAPLSKASSASIIRREDGSDKRPLTVNEKMQFIVVRICVAFSPTFLIDFPIVVSSFLSPSVTTVASPTDANAPLRTLSLGRRRSPAMQLDSKRIVCIIWTVLSFVALFSIWKSTQWAKSQLKKLFALVTSLPLEGRVKEMVTRLHSRTIAAQDGMAK